MHTAEEVRSALRALPLGLTATTMLLAYADLLEEMEEASKDMNEYTLAAATHTLLQRAAEKQKARKG